MASVVYDSLCDHPIICDWSLLDFYIVCVSAEQTDVWSFKNKFLIVEECLVISLGFKRQGTSQSARPSDKHHHMVCFIR